MDKTYKREVASLCLFSCFAIAVTGFWYQPEYAAEVLRILVPASFLFAMGAFGLDSVAKQLGNKK